MLKMLQDYIRLRLLRLGSLKKANIILQLRQQSSTFLHIDFSKLLTCISHFLPSYHTLHTGRSKPSLRRVLQHVINYLPLLFWGGCFLFIARASVFSASAILGFCWLTKSCSCCWGKPKQQFSLKPIQYLAYLSANQSVYRESIGQMYAQ